MEWYNCKKEDLIGLQCTNPYNGKHVLRLSPNSKNLELDENDDSDARYLLIKVNNLPSIVDIKNYLLSLQHEYDNCSEVNGFYINGTKCWFDKATRVGLVNAINLQKQLGNDTYKVWFGNNIVELEIDRALTLLANIENYASECYNITQQHITEINNLSTLDDYLNYDITAGYPAMLNITLD